MLSLGSVIALSLIEPTSPFVGFRPTTTTNSAYHA
jgi:hypothetical protein